MTSLMKKRFFYLSFLIIILLVLGLFFYKRIKTNQQKSIQPKLNVPMLEFYDNQDKKIASFKAEIARTPAEHQRGLMYRKHLPEDQAMLFVFQKEKQLSFWMKNTLIPLDIIFISQDKKVISISDEAQPCRQLHCKSYYSNGKVQYVVEINVGLAKKLGIIKEATLQIIEPNSSIRYN